MSVVEVAAGLSLHLPRCARSGLLHCPACDQPIDEHVNYYVALDELHRGFIPAHRGCRAQPRPPNLHVQLRNDDMRHRRYLKLIERRDEYLDWVERVTELLPGDLALCPSCDAPFFWDMPGALEQYESGQVPGHPACSRQHSPYFPAELMQELTEIERARKAS